MLLFGVFLNSAFLFPVLVPAIPLNSGARNAAAVPNAYLFQTESNSTSSMPNSDSSAFTATCFNSREGLNLTAVAEDCVSVLNDIILRLDGPFDQRAFSRAFYMNSVGHWVRARWVFGLCTIYVRSAQTGPVGMFSFFEVALTANRILSDCMTSHRRCQGGQMPIGSREQSFYVSVQGQLSDNEVSAINKTDILGLPNFEVSKQTLDAKRGFHSLFDLQPQYPNAEVALVSSNEARSPSNSSANLKVQTDPDIDCFPRRSRLPNANADDCMFIINSIIVSMKDPFQPRTWGYGDTVDINLSLPQFRWVFKDCFMRVKNIDEELVDTFSPVDVAEVAQSIVQKCIIDTKERLGGNADIGQLGFPRSFYVVVSGISRSRESLGNDTLLSLPSGGARTLDSRASSVSPVPGPLSMISTEGLNAIYPVNCFDPFRIPRLKDAVVSDCKFIADEIILRLPNPMTVQTFGYTDAADINLAKAENGQWIHGQCVIYIRSMVEKVGQDSFRLVDVAYAAHRIMERCIEGAKYAIGGISDVGTVPDKFYVGVAGMDLADLGNGTQLGMTSDPEALSPSRGISVLPLMNSTISIPSYDDGSTESIDLNKRSSNNTQLGTASGYTPPVRCIQDGMPAARKIEIRDCTDAAVRLLSDPRVLIPQLFTTEPTGGTEMPFVKHIESCYLMMDTSSDVSVSASITLLKMVYWASEIMLTCISGREQGFGGVATLDDDRGIFVSVTGVDPTVVGGELVNLSDEGISAINLENTSLQVVESGQS